MEIKPGSTWKIKSVLVSHRIALWDVEAFKKKVQGTTFRVLEKKDKVSLGPTITQFWFCKSDKLGIFRLRDYTDTRKNERDYGIVQGEQVYNVEIEEASSLKM